MGWKDKEGICWKLSKEVFLQKNENNKEKNKSKRDQGMVIKP